LIRSKDCDDGLYFVEINRNSTFTTTTLPNGSMAPVNPATGQLWENWSKGRLPFEAPDRADQFWGPGAVNVFFWGLLVKL
jgi:hypothetical protein